MNQTYNIITQVSRKWEKICEFFEQFEIDSLANDKNVNISNLYLNSRVILKHSNKFHKIYYWRLLKKL